jgi:hypothetical protein
MNMSASCTCRLSPLAENGVFLDPECQVHMERIPFKVSWHNGRPWCIAGYCLETPEGMPDRGKIPFCVVMGLN